VGLYSKGILQLPFSALTEEFACAKVRLEMTLVETDNKCVREAATVLKTGSKWSANKSVVEAKAALQSGISWDMYSMEEGVWAQFSSC